MAFFLLIYIGDISDRFDWNRFYTVGRIRLITRGVVVKRFGTVIFQISVQDVGSSFYFKIWYDTFKIKFGT